MLRTEADPKEWLDDLLIANKYGHGHLTNRDTYVCIAPFLFTNGIIEGDVGDDAGYSRRWCYEKALALPALEEWKSRGFEGEPVGWKRRI